MALIQLGQYTHRLPNFSAPIQIVGKNWISQKTTALRMRGLKRTWRIKIKITHTEEIWYRKSVKPWCKWKTTSQKMQIQKFSDWSKTSWVADLKHRKGSLMAKISIPHNSFTIATCFKLCRFSSKTHRRQVSKNCKNTTQPASSSTTNMNLSLHRNFHLKQLHGKVVFSDSTSLEVLKCWRVAFF